ncbi:MAG: phosphoserine phosphatase SerB [Pseudomonadota bacterium]|mgnify:CR=1 FL=1
MSVLILTSAAGVTQEMVARVRHAADLPAARRLGPGGVDFAATPEALLAAREALEEFPVDVNLLPRLNRRKRLLIADMDSTIITVECIDEIADMLGVKPQVASITEAAMRGELDFEQALTERVALLKGLPSSTLQQVFDERVTLSPGAATMVQTMRSNGALAVLVSGGFTFFSERVAAAAGFDRHRANVLMIEDGALSGMVAAPILGRQAKLDMLRSTVAEIGITSDEALAVGDGANDLAMLSAAGIGVAYKAKPVVAEQADAQLDHSDLTGVLYLQGYTESDFVSV